MESPCSTTQSVHVVSIGTCCNWTCAHVICGWKCEPLSMKYCRLLPFHLLVVCTNVFLWTSISSKKQWNGQWSLNSTMCETIVFRTTIVLPHKHITALLNASKRLSYCIRMEMTQNGDDTTCVGCGWESPHRCSTCPWKLVKTGVYAHPFTYQATRSTYPMSIFSWNHISRGKS